MEFGQGVRVGRGGASWPVSQWLAFMKKMSLELFQYVQLLNKLSRGSPVPSSAGALSPMATTRPDPNSHVATVTLVFVWDSLFKAACFSTYSATCAFLFINISGLLFYPYFIISNASLHANNF